MHLQMNPLWFALYTRPRFEKKVTRLLEEEGFEAWLPMQTVIRQWSDRKKKVEIPLFSSYVFIRIPKNQLYHAVQIDGVARTVGFSGEPAAIREEQIEMIRKVLKGPEAFEVTETSFVKGETVAIINGPLKGFTGKWVNWKGKKRVSLEIEQLHKSILVTLPAVYIKKI